MANGRVGLALVATVVAFATTAGCGGDEKSNSSCEPGSEGCDCYNDLTCDLGLACVDGVCEVSYGPSGYGGYPIGTGGVGTTGGANGLGGFFGVGGLGTGGFGMGGAGVGGAPGAGGTAAGGAPASGGSPGAGGSGVTTVCTGSETAATGTDPLIDDLEDGDNAAPEVDGRLGYWYTYNDGSSDANQEPVGDFVPTNEGYNSSYSAWTSGDAGFTEWGAGLGINLNTVGDDGCAYDASVYDGISLCVRGTGSVSLRVTTNATVPTTRGGQCTESCDDHFAADITLSDTWECRQIAWSDLSQEGWGTDATFNPAEIIGIQLQFAASTAFTLYVDDLAFWSSGSGSGGAGGGGGASSGGAVGVAGSAGSGGILAAGAGGVGVAGSAGSLVAGAGGASVAGSAGAVITAGAGGAAGTSGSAGVPGGGAAGASGGGAGGAAGGA